MAGCHGRVRLQKGPHGSGRYQWQQQRRPAMQPKATPAPVQPTAVRAHALTCNVASKTAAVLRCQCCCSCRACCTGRSCSESCVRPRCRAGCWGGQMRNRIRTPPIQRRCAWGRGRCGGMLGLCEHPNVVRLLAARGAAVGRSARLVERSLTA